VATDRSAAKGISSSSGRRPPAPRRGRRMGGALWIFREGGGEATRGRGRTGKAARRAGVRSERRFGKFREV
jgi:hypothetical protein